MNEEFGFAPKDSSLSFYNIGEWEKILKRRGLTNAAGFFIPKDLSAHVVRLNGINSLPYVMHEYFGHGAFCELTKTGSMIKDYENKLAILQDKVAHSCASVEERMQFSALTQEYENFFADNRWLFEGFAVWLEEFLLKKTGMEELWKERGLSYKDYYNHFKLFEDRTGPLSLIYKVGFPKNLSNGKITQVFWENIKIASPLVFLVHYGSKEIYSDIDLLAVLENDCEGEVFYDSNLDILLIGKKNFDKKLEWLDLSLVDILKTGTFIDGNKDEYEKSVCCIKRSAPTKGTLDYLRKSSIQYYLFAQHFFNQGVLEGNLELVKKGAYQEILRDCDFPNINFMFSINNLCFALSYFLCANFYADGTADIVSFKDILKLKEASLLRKARELLKSSPTRNVAQFLLAETKHFLCF